MLSPTSKGWILVRLKSSIDSLNSALSEHLVTSAGNHFSFFFLCVCVCSDAHGLLWPSALRCRRAVPSFSFLSWPTSPWQPLWMLVCSQWVSNQSGVMLTVGEIISYDLWWWHFTRCFQLTRTRTKMMSFAHRCTRMWMWRAPRCAWSGVLHAISTDHHAAHTAASVITVWRLVCAQVKTGTWHW